ncbi:metallophosphoesterase [Cohnella suwonensis]|uniref:Metallophosphoesterase n=1 Tax=Cohnella suwonensis TaxID=696072 RepID=A0ABW0M2E2_9BACL
MSPIRFDLISDIHLDFWVENSSNHLKQDKRLDTFLNTIMPEIPSKTLVIAGDLGHYNKQNYRLLEKLNKFYKHILLVPGNHDYYLISKSIKNKYKRNSINRFLEMKLMAEQLSGIHFLDGDQIEVDGIVFGGCGMWYDFEYGLQQLNETWDRVFDNWQSISNDSVLIEGLPRRVEAMFMEEKVKLKKILNSTDVLVTHISPDWSKVPKDKATELFNSYYYFDGKDLFPDIRGRTWCFGHVHRRIEYINHGCRFINASLGYPDENKNLPQKILNVTQ